MTKLKKYFPVLIIAILAIIFLTWKKPVISKESQFLEPLDPNDCLPHKDDNVVLPLGSKGIQVKRLQIRMSYCIQLLKFIKANSTLLILDTDNAIEAYDQFLLHKGVDGILGQYTDNLRKALFNCDIPDFDRPTLAQFRKVYIYLSNYMNKPSKSVMNNISDNSNFN